MKDRHVSVCPHPVTQYPNSAWSLVPSDVDFAQLWQVCGSTVEKHIDRLPMWKVYCALYFEGLVHGSEIERERLTKKQSKQSLPSECWSDCGKDA